MPVRKLDNEWQTYRTRFLIKAKQLTKSLVFLDALGREHCGQKGDYLVESSDSTWRIAPREIFEDIYVPMGPAHGHGPRSERRQMPVSEIKRRASSRAVMPVRRNRKPAVQNQRLVGASQPLRA